MPALLESRHREDPEQGAVSTRHATRSIEEDIRAGLPPADAAGLEPISRAVERFRHGEIGVDDFVRIVDRNGHDIELDLRARIAAALSESAEELAALRASWRWLRRFPCWQPVWAPDDG